MADNIVRHGGTGPSRKSGREVWVTRRPLWLYTARPRGSLDVGPPVLEGRPSVWTLLLPPERLGPGS